MEPGTGHSLDEVDQFLDLSAPVSYLSNVSHLYDPLPLRPSVTPSKPQGRFCSSRWLLILPPCHAMHQEREGVSLGVTQNLYKEGSVMGVASCYLLYPSHPDLMSLSSPFKVLRVNYDVYCLHLPS